MKSLGCAFILLSSCLVAASAQALSYSPQIDFRDAGTWSGANNQADFTGTQAGIDLTITAMPAPATLWWDDKDGLGVRLSYENDEIESHEILSVSFLQAVDLSAIYVSDLFVEDGYIETGSYRIDGGAWVDFDAASLPGTGSNGEHLIAFGTPLDSVSLVEFSAPGKIDGEDHEFALMGFDASPSGSGPEGEIGSAVPEPGAATLFGIGMLIVAARRR